MSGRDSDPIQCAQDESANLGASHRSLVDNRLNLLSLTSILDDQTDTLKSCASMSLDLQSLNADTLCTIVSYLDTAAAWRLSYTARAFHQIAKYHALTSIRLRTFANLVLFCRYMLSQMHHRLFSLRALEVRCGIRSESEISSSSFPTLEHPSSEYLAGAVLLGDLLEKAPRLETFVLLRAEIWMTYEPRIVKAVSAMRHLRAIELDELGPRVSEVLHQTQSAPHKLSLTDPSGWSRHPAKYSMKVDFSLPSVRHLVAEAPHILPPIPDLARAVPSVRLLDLGEMKSNARWTAEGVPAPANFPHLEYLRGSGSALTGWKSLNPVHLVELISPLARDDEDSSIALRMQTTTERHYALFALRHANPVVVIARLDSQLNPEYWGRFIRACPRLRYLCATLEDVFPIHTWVEDLVRWWNIVFPMLGTSGMICLKVRCSVRQTAIDDLNTDELDVTSTSFAQALSAVLTTLPSLATSLPELHFLSIEVYAVRRNPRMSSLAAEDVSPRLYWWQFDGPDDNRIAKTMDSLKGERIAEYLSSTKYEWNKDFDETQAG